MNSNESEIHLSNFDLSAFSEVRLNRRYEEPLFSPPSPRPLLLSQYSYFCPLGMVDVLVGGEE